MLFGLRCECRIPVYVKFEGGRSNIGMVYIDIFFCELAAVSLIVINGNITVYR